MMRKSRYALAMVFLFATAALADTVTLKNGDRITGQVVGTDGKQLSVTTDYAGQVSVAWGQVQAISVDTPVYITTKKNALVSGTAALQGANLIVHTATQGAVTVPLDQVAAIRSADGEAAYEKSRHPSLGRGWAGGANVGYAMARGNSNTTSLTTGFNADRKASASEITMYANSVYTTNGATVAGGPTGVTADAILGGFKVSRDVTARLFGFVSGDYTHDLLQDLVLRQIYTGGLGWHAIKRPNTTLDVLAGANYTRETYSTSAVGATPATSVARNLPGLTVGEIGMHKMGAITTVTEDFYFYPDLSDTSQYRFSLDASAVTKLRKWLGWQISLSDRYVTNPPIPGTKSNDFILSTGLNVSFSH